MIVNYFKKFLHLHHDLHGGLSISCIVLVISGDNRFSSPKIDLLKIIISLQIRLQSLSTQKSLKNHALIHHPMSPSINFSFFISLFQALAKFISRIRMVQLGSVIFRSIIYREIQNIITSINAHGYYQTYNTKKDQIFSMQTHPSIKNYYKLLGVSENASLFEIQSAYEKLAAKWHPDKHKEHRKSAETRFKEIAEAFEVLSDQNKRSHYDEILHKEYSLVDAQATFDRFFNEHGFVDQQQEKFFNTNFPNPLNNYYNILGVPKNASLEDIKNAYRKLSLKYHPKNNPNDEQAHKKFIEVNEAYNALSSEFRRENYDNIMFGTIQPVRAYNIFDDFFGSRFPSVMDEEFRPFFHNRWSRDLDRLMIDEGEEKNIKDGQTVKSSSVWSNKNGKESGKTITTRTTFKGGKANEERTEDYLFPSGERKVTKTIRTPEGKVDTKEFRLKKGEELPKELTQ